MSLNEAIEIAVKLAPQESNLDKFVKALLKAKKGGNRVWVAGCGGSASTASHFCSDLMNLGIDVVCLTDNTSRVSAITNDFGWEYVFAYQMTHFIPDDVFVPISVHGAGKIGDTWSQNLILGAIEARKRDGKVLSLIGCDGGRLKEYSTETIIVPDSSCCYVEGFHSLICHIICEKIKGKTKNGN